MYIYLIYIYISKQINSKDGLVENFDLVINKGMSKQNNYH